MQLTEMLDRNIIRVSSSPWLAPAVYVPKKSGEIRICIDYRELNTQTVKDAYPLPLPDEIQDRLSGSKVFSKLYLHVHSAYWQLPVKVENCMKTACFLSWSWYGSMQICTEECQKAFLKLKGLLSQAPVLCYSSLTRD